VQLYNDFADQAEFYDLSLLIYQAADHRITQDVTSTWFNLISKKHEEAEAAGQEPYMTVAETIRELGTKLNLSETIFPIGKS
jgi:nuclear pore complex protein Nup155